MHDDSDDTVLVPSHRHSSRGSQDAGIDEDTIVPTKPAAESAPSQSDVTPASAEAITQGGVAFGDGASEVQVAHQTPPALIDPAPRAKPRRVPLTHKRVQETLPVRDYSQGSTVLPEVHITDSAPVYGFRIGDHAPITLDVPALVGRKPAAPRIYGNVFPRLVHVSSPLSEVSSTHVELRQQGSSVIVTDLRSTNGTIVRMPGSRPVKLRQGDSLVVRPGTLVDIGDGNVLEILPPPRLSVAGDALGEGLHL